MSDLEFPHYDLVKVDVDGPVGILTLNAPNKLNAIGAPMLRDLIDATNRLNNAPEIRVVVLTGEGRGFSAGADLTDDEGLAGSVADGLNQNYRPTLLAIATAPKPWISAVNGAAAGIGSAYAMTCDLTVMAENAYIFQAFAGIGLIPDGGATWQLVNTIGRKRAYEIIATGERVPAQRCLEWGLCNRVVPNEELLPATVAWAHELSERAPLALRYAKDSTRTAANSDWSTTYDREAELQNVCAESEDFREGVRAFREKRKAEFRGR